MKRIAPVLAAALALSVAAFAQDEPPKTPAPKEEAPPAAVKPSADKIPGMKQEYSLPAADKDLKDAAAALAEFETCADSSAFLQKDAAETEKKLSADPAKGSNDQLELLAIKNTRMGQETIACAKMRNDVGTAINVLAANLNAIWPPTDPGIQARRDQLLALDEKYLAAAAKMGQPAKKVNVVSANPPDVSPPKLPKTKKVDPAPPKPSSGEQKGFSKF